VRPVNTLITSASRKVWLIRAFQQAVRPDGKVVAADADPQAVTLRLADAGEVLPMGLKSSFTDRLDRLIDQHEISLVIPTRDEELYYFARRAEEFRRRGVQVMVSPAEVIRICQDKLAFVRFCQAHGLPVPRSWSGEEIEQIDLFPVFLRPATGKASRSVSVARDAHELRQAAQQIERPIVQEYIEAPEFTVDIFCDFQGRVLTAVPRERIRVVGGESQVTRTVSPGPVLHEAVRLVQALGLVGHVTVQCFFDGRQVLFVEVNPRFGGAAKLSFRAGAETPRMLVDLCQSRCLAPRIGEYEVGLTMYRYAEDIFVSAGENDNA
jgi:carbamoyl-phosphate synthase large subunit